MVDKKNKYVPGFLVSIVLSILDGSIEDRAKFSLYEVEPKRYVRDLLWPAYYIVGQGDEFIPIEPFTEMFIAHPMVKVLKAVPGGHADDREQHVINDAVRFVVSNFDSEEMKSGVNDTREEIHESRQRFMEGQMMHGENMLPPELTQGGRGHGVDIFSNSTKLRESIHVDGFRHTKPDEVFEREPRRRELNRSDLFDKREASILGPKKGQKIGGNDKSSFMDISRMDDRELAELISKKKGGAQNLLPFDADKSINSRSEEERRRELMEHIAERERIISQADNRPPINLAEAIDQLDRTLSDDGRERKNLLQTPKEFNQKAAEDIFNQVEIRNSLHANDIDIKKFKNDKDPFKQIQEDDDPFNRSGLSPGKHDDLDNSINQRGGKLNQSLNNSRMGAKKKSKILDEISSLKDHLKGADEAAQPMTILDLLDDPKTEELAPVVAEPVPATTEKLTEKPENTVETVENTQEMGAAEVKPSTALASDSQTPVNAQLASKPEEN